MHKEVHSTTLFSQVGVRWLGMVQSMTEQADQVSPYTPALAQASNRNAV